MIFSSREKGGEKRSAAINSAFVNFYGPGSRKGARARRARGCPRTLYTGVERKGDNSSPRSEENSEHEKTAREKRRKHMANVRPCLGEPSGSRFFFLAASPRLPLCPRCIPPQFPRTRGNRVSPPWVAAIAATPVRMRLWDPLGVIPPTLRGPGFAGWPDGGLSSGGRGPRCESGARPRFPSSRPGGAPEGGWGGLGRGRRCSLAARRCPGCPPRTGPAPGGGTGCGTPAP